MNSRFSDLESIKIIFDNRVFYSHGNFQTYPFQYDVEFEELKLGRIESSEKLTHFNHFHVASLLMLASFTTVEYSKKVLDWVIKVKEILPDKFDWVGVYFKESFLCNNDSRDLVLGPFLGAPTEHIRIPIDKGLCGLALREEKVINVGDVHERSEHIACSLETRSELIIPIKDQNGRYVAEIDIDSNQYHTFKSDIEEQVKALCLSFPQL